MRRDDLIPDRLIRFCGADCSSCETYRHLLAGDASGLVNPKTQYRCCWLPADYPEGRDCPIRTCCEEKGHLFCGECDQFEGCTRMSEFYSQPGYDECRKRMFEEIAGRNTRGLT
jgi:hypothetical protein